jgi:hypothetical protein
MYCKYVKIFMSQELEVCDRNVPLYYNHCFNIDYLIYNVVIVFQGSY